MTTSGPPSESGFFRPDEANARRFGAHAQPTLITAAAESFEEQHRARKRRYTMLMIWRIPALLLSGLVYGIWGNGLIALLIVLASVPLPWIAVLIANDRPPRRKDEPSQYAERRRLNQPAIEAPRPETIEG